MPEVTQAATAKKLTSEIYFTSSTTLRDPLKNTFARNNSSFIESKSRAILHMLVDIAIYDNKQLRTHRAYTIADMRNSQGYCYFLVRDVSSCLPTLLKEIEVKQKASANWQEK